MKEQWKFRRFVPVLVVLALASVPAFAKDARNLNLAYPVVVGGSQIAPGDYKVAWEQHSPEATVSFMKGKKVLATAQAKWVERNVKYQRNSVVYDTAGDGSRRIVEIRFAGMSQVMVLGEASPTT